MPITGEMSSVAIEDLKLDAKNPRLPEKHGMGPDDQADLTVFVAEEYDALRIARSIAEFGYFPTEPPICVEENESLVVVEGNRRLAALKILSSGELREHAELSSKAQWEELAISEHIPDTLQVLVVASRHEVAPLVAYRHISGIEAWEPWAQARFVATLIDEEGAAFEEAASLVGETPQIVKRFYRDYAVLRQASDDFDIDTSRPEGQFGVFTRAMQDGGIRQYLGAPTPAATVKGENPLPEDKRDEVLNIIGWIFGAAGKPKVIDESRDISSLGRVLSSDEPEALRLLTEEGDLPAAFAAAGGIKDRLIKNLRDSNNAAVRAEEDLPNYSDDQDVLDSLGELTDTVNRLGDVP